MSFQCTYGTYGGSNCSPSFTSSEENSEKLASDRLQKNVHLFLEVLISKLGIIISLWHDVMLKFVGCKIFTLSFTILVRIMIDKVIV